MNANFLLKGLLIGFAIAAPVGPIGMLCIQRTLNYGRRSGFATGLGAATADAAYGAVAAFGLTAISYFLLTGQTWLRIIGGAFLVYLGTRTLFSKAAPESNGRHISLLSDYFSSVFLTLANPATIISFLAVFAGIGIGALAGSVALAVTMVAGVFFGSALWWLILTSGVGLLRSAMSASFLRIANIASGIILLAFAAYALISASVGG